MYIYIHIYTCINYNDIGAKNLPKTIDVASEKVRQYFQLSHGRSGSFILKVEWEPWILSIFTVIF